MHFKISEITALQVADVAVALSLLEDRSSKDSFSMLISSCRLCLCYATQVNLSPTYQVN